MAAGQVPVDGRVGLDPGLGAAGYLADDASRDAGGHHAVGDLHARRYRGARGDQGAAADDGAVQHRGPVADQRLLADPDRVNHAQVADGRPFPDLARDLAAAVQHRSVLHVGPAPDHDRPEVRPDHRAVPDRRFLFDPHVPDQSGGRRDPRTRADGRLTTFE